MDSKILLNIWWEEIEKKIEFGEAQTGLTVVFKPE